MVGLWVHNPPTLFEFSVVASSWALVLVPECGCSALSSTDLSPEHSTPWLGDSEVDSKRERKAQASKPGPTPLAAQWLSGAVAPHLLWKPYTSPWAIISLSAWQHGCRLLSKQRTPQLSRVWESQQHSCHS